MVMIFGEITTSATVNYEQVIREALKDIGYDDVAKVRLINQNPCTTSKLCLTNQNPRAHRVLTTEPVMSSWLSRSSPQISPSQ